MSELLDGKPFGLYTVFTDGRKSVAFRGSFELGGRVYLDTVR